MRITLLSLFICTMTFSLLAQEETLIGGQIESGGFGGPVVKAGTFNGETGVLVGGRGGWIINHCFILGGGGYGLANNVPAKSTGLYGSRYLNFGYGGLQLEYVVEPSRLINFSLMTLIGGGAVGWRDEMMAPNSNSSVSFFVVEPEINVTLNVTTFFRVGGGASYRYVSNFTSSAAKSSDVNGPSGSLTFRFGKF
jgi:hypothetical protein